MSGKSVDFTAFFDSFSITAQIPKTQFFKITMLWGKPQYHFLRHYNLSFAFLGMTIKSEFYCQK